MNNQVMGMIIGGFLPALLFGISGLLQKSCQRAGIGIGWYIVFIGIGVVVTGLSLIYFKDNRSFTPTAGMLSIVLGIVWAAATALIGLSLSRYGVPISRLAPLYNMNTLVAVLLGMTVYAEWKESNPFTLIIGAVCVIAGGVLVAKS